MLLAPKMTPDLQIWAADWILRSFYSSILQASVRQGNSDQSVVAGASLSLSLLLARIACQAYSYHLLMRGVPIG